MSTEFNYVVKLDTTSVMGSLAEVRNQVGMAFGGMGGGGGGAGTQMMRGLEKGLMSGFGRTHTDPGMAYDPHYGQVHATTTRGQEKAVANHGLAAAEAMRPPGVSAYEYAMGVHGNAIDRQNGARRDATMAAQSTFFSGVAGLGAAEVSYLGGAMVGKSVGGAVAKRFLGAGAAGAGRMIGGMGLGIAAAFAAEDYVGGRIRDHYAEVEKISGVTNEMADIVGGGRGLSKVAEYRLGMAAVGAAKDVNMDSQQMGAIASLARNTGMLPSSTDPDKVRKMLGDYAKAIDEGASALHTSLGNAAMIAKSASGQGIGAEEAFLRAGSAGGAEQYLAQNARRNAFGNQGGQFGLQQRLTQKQGFDMFTGAIGQAAGAGMSSDASQVLGGKYGTAQLLAVGQMGAATSSMGDMQLMAASGGFSGGSMLDMPGQAMAAMSQGGDFVSNMLKFQVNKDELRRGIGAKGIRTMAKQQLVAGGEMIRQLAPGLSDRESESIFVQNNMGMNPTQAMAYVGGMHSKAGGGGGRKDTGAGYAGRLEAFEGLEMHRAGLAALGTFDKKTSSDYAGGYGFGMGMMVEGALIGGSIGSAPGAIAGAVSGFAVGNYNAAKDFAGDLFGGGGPGIMSSAETKANHYNLRERADHDSKIAAFKDRYGSVDLNMEVAARINQAPLRRATLSADGNMSEAAAARYGGFADMSGVSTMEAGPGATTINGRSYNTNELRKATRDLSKPLKYTKAAKEAALAITSSGSTEVNEARNIFRQESWRIKSGDFNIAESAGAEAQVAAERNSILRREQAVGVMIMASGNAEMISAFRDEGLRNREVSAVAHWASGMKGSEPNFRLSEKRDMALVSAVSGGSEQAIPRMSNYIYRNFAGSGGNRSSSDLSAEFTRLTNYSSGTVLPGSNIRLGEATLAEFSDKFGKQGYDGFLRKRIRNKGTGFLGEMDSDGALAAKAALGLTSTATAADIQDRVRKSGGSKEFIDSLMASKKFRTAAFGGKGPNWDKMESIAEDISLSGSFRGADPKGLIESMRNDVPKASTLERVVGSVAEFLGQGDLAKEVLSPGKFTANAKKFGKHQLDSGEKVGDSPGGKSSKGSAASGGMSHTIGFGEQESAMATINKSLKRTHDMIESLDKRIGKGRPTGGKNESQPKGAGS